MWRTIEIVMLLLCSVCAYGEEKVFRTEGAVVSYSGINEAYAEAIALTVATARDVAVEVWGFDMPETIHVDVQTNPDGRVRLFNDGQDRLILRIRSEDDLRKPAVSGIFHIYGLCHEVGHLGMYRVIGDHSWMTTGAAEGWAHYAGSRIVDAVHSGRGESLWPDTYDYLADGTRRLDGQLSGEKPGATVKGAALWKELVGIVGEKGVAPVFAAWGKAEIDRSDPGAALRKALLATREDQRLGTWWNKAEALMIIKQPRSGFAARRAKTSELTGKPVEHAHDDGTAAGKNSIAGSGHGVRFSVLGGGWYLTSVRIHGSRYGQPRPPRENFHVWLCDKDLKVIAEFTFRYAKFTRGGPRWVTLKTVPTSVPQDFVICVGFNPARTKGVYVSRDKESSGDSLTGLPGRGSRSFDKGDWLIRARVDLLSASNPLLRQGLERRQNPPEP